LKDGDPFSGADWLFLFVLNGAAPRANITAEAVAALSEHAVLRR